MSFSTNLTSIPPPPPVLASFRLNRPPQLCQKTDTAQVRTFFCDECTWAHAYPELQKACYIRRVCTYSPPKICRYNNIPSMLQVGPTCGLLALSMLLDGDPAPEELLKTAKQLHYTNNGEMFSAKNLFKLICDTVSNVTRPGGMPQIECQLHEGQLNCAKVRSCLLDGACIFVPYDSDADNSPCLKFGHKAHWALIIGFLIDEMDEFYVIARHGKSKNLAVWSLKSISASNANLEEFSQPNIHPDYHFLLPKDGIGGVFGLKNQSIIASGLKKEIIVVR